MSDGFGSVAERVASSKKLMYLAFQRKPLTPKP